MGNELTKNFLVEAGITQGMRVLDFGCGMGIVTRLAAELVGDQGGVVGVDIDENAIAQANKQVEESKATNLKFVVGSFDFDHDESAPFDAIIGRRVLMYQADPTHCLSMLLKQLKPGGILVSQEYDSASLEINKSLELHSKTLSLMSDTIKAEGAHMHMGLDLVPCFLRAGIIVKGMRAVAVTSTPAAQHTATEIIRAMIPRIKKATGLSEDDIDVNTLAQRLEDEIVEADTTFVWGFSFGAWGTKRV